MHAAENVSAARTPLQGATDCGAFQRRSPTGGAANGMPLNTRTPFALTPEIWPLSILTVSGALNRRDESAAVTANTINVGESERFIEPPSPRRHEIEKDLLGFVFSWVRAFLPANHASSAVARGKRR